MPQGTVLAPILFLIIYINDLPDYIKHSQIRLFADDSIIYRPIKTQADCIKLQEDLESAVKWEQDWLRERPFNSKGGGGGGGGLWFFSKKIF